LAKGRGPTRGPGEGTREMSQVEGCILGWLLKNPSFIKISGPFKEFIKNEKTRRIISAIEKITNDGGNMDELILSEKTGISITEILALIPDGLQNVSEENFLEHVSILKKKNFMLELFSEANKQRLFIEKGMEPDVNYVLEVAEKIKQSSIDIEKKGPQAETLQEFLAHDLPKRENLINPLFGVQEMTMIHGRPKIGKSLATLQIVRSLITGDRFLGFETYKQERPIIIIQVEIAPALMQERVRKIFKDIAGSEKIIIPFQNRNIFLDQKSGREHVSRLIEDYKPVLVILDPYLKFFTDEETAFKNPKPFFDFWQEQIETHVLSLLFVHHDAKFQEGKIGGQKALGATLINASTDNNWSIERILDTGLDPVEFLRTARLSFESRNWQNMKPLDIRLNDNLTFEVTTLPKGSVNEWDIVEDIEKAGGQVEQKKVENKYSSKRAFYQAKTKALEMELIDEVRLDNVKGRPVMLILKNRDSET
jgi:hypothetical protein